MNLYRFVWICMDGDVCFFDWIYRVKWVNLKINLMKV